MYFKSPYKVSVFLVLSVFYSIGFAQEAKVYSVNSGIFLGEYDLANSYTVLGESDDAKIIRFDKPTVQGWVSSDYLDINNATGMATVTVDNLNFRIRPSLNAKILTKLYQGYKTPILKREAGFSLVLAPSKLEVLVKSDVEQKSIEKSGWSRLSKKNTPSESSAKSTDSSIDSTVDFPAETTVAVGVVRSFENATLESPGDEQVVAESVQSSLIGQLTPDAKASLGELNHKLAAGDSISLLVFGESDLSAENVRIPQSGQVSFPLIGSVDVLGKTTTEVESEVSRILSKGYVKNPRLSVSIFSYRPIFIRGEVASAGSFPYSEGLTVAKAIALAGGISDTAKEDGISILRDGELVVENLSIDSQYRVVSGDIVTVSTDLEEKEAETAYVFLHGEVESAGAYEFQQGLTVEKAVVLAGGFSLRAAKGKISVSRYAEADETGAPKLMKRVKLHEPIMPGDVIKVGASWF